MSEFKWISVDDDWPEIGKHVLVRGFGGYTLMTPLEPSDRLGEMTHWSYIPAPVSELDTLRARVAELEAEKASGGFMAFKLCMYCKGPIGNCGCEASKRDARAKGVVTDHIKSWETCL